MAKKDENGNPKKVPFSLQLDLSKFSSANFEKATDEEKSQQDVMSESTTFFKDGMRKLFKNPLAVGSIIVLSLILIIIIFAPLIVPYSYEEILSVDCVRDKGAKNLAPFTYRVL
ncbi:MAG: ABC transporter permease, partial [bacterium]|nr:ABC transporter permease [bacterium]